MKETVKFYKKDMYVIISKNIIYKSFLVYTKNIFIAYDDLYKHDIWNY